MRLHSRIVVTGVLILSCAVCIFAYNLSQWNTYRRQKRALIFPNSGTAKLVAGVIMPFNLQEKKAWRQMNLAMNFQAQYALPQKPVYWWNKFDGRTLHENLRQFNNSDPVPEDQSQKLVFKMIEYYMNNNGQNGRKCLQRAICENAEIDEVDGIVSELLKVILTPNEGCYDTDLNSAYEAGKAGACCVQLYPECPLGTGLLDSLSVVLTKGLL